MNTTSMYEKSANHVNRTYIGILTDPLVLYKDSRTDILYYYAKLLMMNCTSVYTTHINGIHTRTLHFIYIYVYRFLYRYIILLYRSCTDGLYFCVHWCTTWHNINIKFWCTHYAQISYTAVWEIKQDNLHELRRPITVLTFTPPHPTITSLITAC